MILDILDNIKEHLLDIRGVLNICALSTHTHEMLYIYNLYDYKINNLDQEVIERKKYSKLKKLCIFGNKLESSQRFTKNTGLWIGV